MREEVRVSLFGIPGGFGAWEAALDAAHAQNPDCALALDTSGVEEMPFFALRALDRFCGPRGADRLTGVGAELGAFLKKTGFLKRFGVEESEKETPKADGRGRISVLGLPVVGVGGRSTVYRLSEDRAVKAYRGEAAASALEKMLGNLRVAAEIGIPAAIPLELAETDAGPGAVLEYLDGELLADRMRARPEVFDSLAAEFARAARLLADTRVEEGRMAYTNEFYAGALNRLSGLLSAEEIFAYERAVRSAPLRNTAVHGDFHLRNLIVDGNGDFRLIDLDDFGCGHPVWDAASVAMAYWLIPQKNADDADLIRFTGLTRAEAERLFEIFENEYFRDLPKDEAGRRIFAAKTYAYVRYARMIGDLYGHKGAEGLSLDALRGALFEIAARMDETEKTLLQWN